MRGSGWICGLHVRHFPRVSATSEYFRREQIFESVLGYRLCLEPFSGSFDRDCNIGFAKVSLASHLLIRVRVQAAELIHKNAERKIVAHTVSKHDGHVHEQGTRRWWIASKQDEIANLRCRSGFDLLIQERGECHIRYVTQFLDLIYPWILLLVRGLYRLPIHS